MKRRHALALLAAGPALAHAQAARPTAPPPSAMAVAAAAELAADIDLANEILTTLHPGLLRFSSQLQIDASLASLRRAFSSAPNAQQRYRVLSRFLAMLRCGHSYANFYNQKPEIARELFDRRSRLPLSTRWIGEGLFVTAALDDRLPRGTQIGAINGVPVRTMLATLMAYVRADGANDAQRRSLLALRRRAPLETFDVFHGLAYGEPPGGVFRLDVRTPDGVISVRELPALTMDEVHALLPQPAPDEPRWDWRVDEAAAVAVLAMPSWALPEGGGWDWRGWLGERLDALAGDAALKGLVVDLRGNEGGLHCGDAILERFLRSDSVLPLRRLVRYQKTPEHLNRHLDADDASLRDWGGRARPFDARHFELPALPPLRPQGQPVEGKRLVVITDAANGASAFTFAQRVKASGVGRLVGEPTGGNQRGINSGAFFFVRLPASGLEFDLPLIGQVPLQLPQPDGGIAPDEAVPQTAEDLALGHDAALTRALALARG